MEFHVTIKTKHVLVILIFITTASAIGLVVGYGTFTPSTFGHSWGEIDCDNNLCVNTATGRVGIGTTGPGYPLEVFKTGASWTTVGYFKDTTVAGYPLVQVGDGTNAISIGHINANPLAANYGFISYSGLDPTAGQGIILKSNGNVGIGTPGPGAKLDIINGAISSDTQIGRFDAPGSTAGIGYVTFGGGFVGWDYTNGGLGINAHSAGGSVGGMFIKRVDNSHSNVGIGTPSPGYTLDVNGNARVTDFYLTDGVQIQGLSGRNYFRDTEGAGNLRVGAAWGMPGIYAESGVGVLGGAGGASLQNNALFVTTGGNVGIGGTTSPQAKLHVTPGSGSTIPAIFTTYDFNGGSNIGSQLRISFGSSSGNTYSVLDARSSGTSAPNNLILQQSNGNVGIGTANPGIYAGQQSKLDVNGAVHFMAGTHSVMMTSVPGYLEYYIDGNMWGVSMWASSERFKTNITDLELDSSKIYNLSPVSFNWKPDRGGSRDFGLIAEEAAKVEPLLITYDKEGKPFSVRYEMISVLLLNELKKINTEVKDLKTENSELKQLICQNYSKADVCK